MSVDFLAVSYCFNTPFLASNTSPEDGISDFQGSKVWFPAFGDYYAPGIVIAKCSSQKVHVQRHFHMEDVSFYMQHTPYVLACKDVSCCR